MRIVLTAYGTLGDVLPYIALGQTLQSRGHRVGIATSRALANVVHGAGLEAFSCYPEIDAEDVRSRHSDFDDWRRPNSGRTPYREFDWIGFDLEARIRGLLEACRNADLFVRTGALTGEGIVQEILGIPAVNVTVGPERLWNPDFRSFLRELESGRAGESERPLVRDYYAWHQAHRRRAGLPDLPAYGWEGYFRPPTLLGVSRHILQSFDLTEWNATPCGFWFYEAPEWRAWQPDRELAAFMDRSPAPLVLSYSSQPVADPARVIGLHLEAARRIGRPLLAQSGWAGLTGAAEDGVMFRGFMPQDWLFEKAGCVIHHGGIGTIARALRNGCPMLVEPHSHDQFFNALLVVKGGFGAAANPVRMRSDTLARLLEEKVLINETKRMAEDAALLLRAENGPGAAADAIESRCDTHTGLPARSINLSRVALGEEPLPLT